MQVLIRGIEYTIEDYGCGMPLLCLSAFPFGSVMWREQRTLADIARLIVPDYRGIGQSSGTDEPATMELLAGDMLALLDYLQLSRAVVMGASMGAYIAFAMYAAHPERVRALILADTRPQADTPEAAARRRQTVEGLRTQGTGILHSRIDDLFAATTRETRPELVAEFQAINARENAEGLAQLTLGMAARPDRVDLLGQIRVPTLVLCGEEDTVSPPEVMREMANRISGARFCLIPRAGHLSALEQPAAFNSAVREFLGELTE